MRRILVSTCTAAVLLGFAPDARADVQLSIRDGLVTLNATNATVRQILEQWARVGQTRIVNVERIAGAPVTMQLVDMPEARALDVIMRSVSGYVAAPRPVDTPNLSRFDRILVLPTSTPRNAPAANPAATFQQPEFAQPPSADDPAEDEDEDEEPAPNVVVPNPRGPIFNAFPSAGQPGRIQTGDPRTTAPEVAMPTTVARPGQFGGAAPGVPQPAAPAGVAVPGMVVPAPQPPGQPGQFAPGQFPPGQFPPGTRDEP